MAELFKPGDAVEAFGLSSESGKSLNGRRGIVFRHHKDTDRVEVRFPGEEKARSLDAERLRRVDSVKSTAPVDEAAPETPAVPAASATNEAAAVDSDDDEPEITLVSAQDGPSSNGAAAKRRTLDDLEVDDRVEAFGLKGHQAVFNGKAGVIMQIASKGKEKRGVYATKFSELVIDSSGELAEKGQVVNLLRENCRVPGTGQSGEKHEEAAPQKGFSKAKASSSSSETRSRSRRRKKSKRSKSRKRRRR